MQKASRERSHCAIEPRQYVSSLGSSPIPDGEAVAEFGFGRDGSCGRNIVETLRTRALILVREQYEWAARMKHTPIERINRVRPPALQYRSPDEMVREWLACAGAVANFAHELGLITTEEAKQVILDFCAAHPEMQDAQQGAADLPKPTG